jgi:hypothetical protein
VAVVEQGSPRAEWVRVVEAGVVFDLGPSGSSEGQAFQVLLQVVAAAGVEPGTELGQILMALSPSARSEVQAVSAELVQLAELRLPAEGQAEGQG